MEVPTASNPSPSPNWNRGDILFALGCLLLLMTPCLLMARHLAAGRIPHYMDTVMYFYPLRWHAAQLMAGGEWPWWNRCILAGTPLFANPQSALAYPFHFLFFAAPGGFGFLFPMLLQLGLFGAFTALLLRRWNVSWWLALFVGAVAVAGNYGWTRLQFGNYMNVLPWMPLMLWAADRGATGFKRSWIVASGCVAMLLLSGAHQLAAYAIGAQILFHIWMLATDADHRRGWGAGLALMLASGLCMGALGWLPQLYFLRETGRGDGLETASVLAGSLPDVWALLRVFAGVTSPAAADAESAGSIGLFVLAAAFVVPSDSTARRRWAGAIIVAILTSLFSLRVVLEPLLKVIPVAGLFHDPRRILGVTQYWLLVASGISISSLCQAQRFNGAQKASAIIGALIAGIAAIAVARFAGPRDAFDMTLLVAPTVLALALALLLFIPLAPQMHRAIILVALALQLFALGTNTARTTPLDMIQPDELYSSGGALLPAISENESPINPPRRFFSLDWSRETSYDFRRPDLAQWMLPNLAMMHGREDLGGYEPARTPRYDRWSSAASDWPGGRQPWIAHFGLIHPYHPLSGAGLLPLLEAAVTDVLLPRWGMPIYLRELSPGRWGGLTPSLPDESLEVRLVIIPGGGASDPRSLLLARNGQVLRTAMLDEDSGSTISSSLAEGSPVLEHFQVITSRVEPSSIEVTNSVAPYEATLLLSPGDILVGLYIWSDSYARAFHPTRSDTMAMHARVNDAPQWLAFRSADGTRSDLPEILGASVSSNAIRIKLRSTHTQPLDLEIHDAFWSGWRATINGEKSEIVPSGPDQQGLWRTIELHAAETSGRAFDVSLTYRPPGLITALLLTLLGALICIGVIIPHKRHETINSDP